MRNRLLFVVIGLIGWVGAPHPSRAGDVPQTRPAAQAAPYEKEILAFEVADRAHAPPPDANLFVGSSSIRMWKTLAADFPNNKVINRGFGGSQIADSVKYANRIVIPYRPARIFFYAGDNDLNAGKSPETVAADFTAFEKKVHAALPDVDIYFIAAKPSPSRAKIIDKDRALNRLVEQYTKEHSHLGYIDVFTPMLAADGQTRPELFGPDMLHMNATGYAMWTKIIAPLLK
jgi:lysophospholipase L1-like esterase